MHQDIIDQIAEMAGTLGAISLTPPGSRPANGQPARAIANAAAVAAE